MSLRFLRGLVLLPAIFGSFISAADLSDGIEKGENYYVSGDFKRAISEFEGARIADPGNAETYLWLGRSYTRMADLKPPILSARARMKARRYFAKAIELAPDSAEYRSEVLRQLLTADDSPSALREAKLLVGNIPRSDPDYEWMKNSLAKAEKQHSSPEYVTTEILSAPFDALAHFGRRSGSGNHQSLFSQRGK